MILFRFLVLIFFAMPAMAQEQGYIEISFTNLGRSYWKLGRLNIYDNQDLTEHMRLFHCDIYQNYYQDDFAWRNILEALSHDLKRIRDDFPLRYEFTAPVYLDRYDFDSGRFLLDQKSKLIQVNSLPLLNNADFNGYCGNDRSVPQFPDNVTVSFVRSFDFTGIPMAEADAEKLIDYFKQQNNEERLVFVKIQFSIHDYAPVKEAIRSNSLELLGNFRQIEVSADQSGAYKIYNSTIK